MKFSQLKQASKKGENIRFPGSQDKSSRVTHSTTDSLLEDSNRENQDQAQAKQKVEHNYHDHARDKVITKEKLTVAKPTDLDTSSSGRGQTSKRVRGGCVRVFPEALYNMLAVSDGTRMSKHNEETSATSAPTGTTNGGGFENIISWLPHGRSFLIRNPDEFVRTIMPR